jgi:hypothetical protein
MQPELRRQNFRLSKYPILKIRMKVALTMAATTIHSLTDSSLIHFIQSFDYTSALI